MFILWYSHMDSVEKQIHLISFLINFVISTFSMFLSVVYIKKYGKHVRKLPKTLRFFLFACWLPFVGIMILGSFLASSYYILYNTIDSLFFKLIRVTLSFSAQQLRSSLFILILDRMLATIYLEKYAKPNLAAFVVLTILNYTISFVFNIPLVMRLFFREDQSLDSLTVYIVITMHILTLVICKVLHIKNQQLYRMLVYRVTLKRRHQIFVNLKVLKYLWPSIVLFSTIAPLGPIVAVIYTLVTPYKTAPLAVFHLFYLISFVSIMVFRLKNERKARIQKAKATTVVNPWGKTVPANVSVDKYFDALNQQWS